MLCIARQFPCGQDRVLDASTRRTVRSGVAKEELYRLNRASASSPRITQLSGVDVYKETFDIQLEHETVPRVIRRALPDESVEPVNAGQGSLSDPTGVTVKDERAL